MNLGKIAMIFFVLLLVGVLFYFTKSIEVSNNECLISIAKDYCNENEMVFESVGWDFDSYFICNKDSRIRNYDNVLFYFLDEELERCKE